MVIENRKSEIGSRNWKMGKANHHQDRSMYLYCDATYKTRILTQARRLCQGQSFTLICAIGLTGRGQNQSENGNMRRALSTMPWRDLELVLNQAWWGLRMAGGR
jgi:hypothetical protein